MKIKSHFELNPNRRHRFVHKDGRIFVGSILEISDTSFVFNGWIKNIAEKGNASEDVYERKMSYSFTDFTDDVIIINEPAQTLEQ